MGLQEIVRRQTARQVLDIGVRVEHAGLDRSRREKLIAGSEKTIVQIWLCKIYNGQLSGPAGGSMTLPVVTMS